MAEDWPSMRFSTELPTFGVSASEDGLSRSEAERSGFKGERSRGFFVGLI